MLIILEVGIQGKNNLPGRNDIIEQSDNSLGQLSLNRKPKLDDLLGQIRRGSTPDIRPTGANVSEISKREAPHKKISSDNIAIYTKITKLKPQSEQNLDGLFNKYNFNGASTRKDNFSQFKPRNPESTSSKNLQANVISQVADSNSAPLDSARGVDEETKLKTKRGFPHHKLRLRVNFVLFDCNLLADKD